MRPSLPQEPCHGAHVQLRAPPAQVDPRRIQAIPARVHPHRLQAPSPRGSLSLN